MKAKKYRLITIISMLLVLGIALTSCGKSVKDEALEKVKAVDLKA